MSLERVRRNVAVFGERRLPSKVVKVTRSETGERIVEGVKAFVDSFPDIPFGKRDHHGDFIAYSRADREALHMAAVAKAERAAKRAAKPAKVKPVKVEEPTRTFGEAMAHIAASQVGTEETKSFVEPGEGKHPKMTNDERIAMIGNIPLHTVKRGGKWVQVGSDNLSAFIEAR